MKKVYSVEGKEFRSKKALEDFAREILKKDAVGSLLEGFDLDFMLSYFSQFHCEWITKKGVGVKALRRIKEPRYGKYRAFQLLRIDGTSTDISFILSNIGVPNYEKWFAQALRKVIEPQIIAFRKQAFAESKTLICSISKQEITSNIAHVDHYEPTFHVLMKNFISENNIRVTADLFPLSVDNQIEYGLVDEDLKSAFYAYHEQFAKLRMLHFEANLKKSNC